MTYLEFQQKYYNIFPDEIDVVAIVCPSDLAKTQEQLYKLPSMDECGYGDCEDCWNTEIPDGLLKELMESYGTVNQG